MAMTRRQEMKFVLMPLAMPHVIAGIRTAAVISIGTATLAAFIGAGGLGDPIVTGLALNDTRLILQGAIPAAVLAILTEILFSFVERSLVVPHMRSSARPA
jgi:osmoprotectant transport system permease protein